MRADDGTSKDRYFPWIAFAPNGSLCTVWYDNRNDSGNLWLDVYASVSIDGGASWAPDFKVTTDISYPNSQFGSPFFGDYIGVTADANSVFHALWCDARQPAYEQEIYGATITVVPPLRLQAVLGNYSASPLGYGLTLALWKNGQSVYSQPVTLGSDGGVTVNLPSGVGSFDQVSLVGPRFLRTKVAYAGTQLHTLEMRNGDVDSSGMVNLIDLGAVLLGFGTSVTTTEDLDGSGAVELVDIGIVLTNFTQTDN